MCKIKQLGDIEARFLADDRIELLDDISFILIERDKEITIHAGFRSDGASIPRFFWRLVGHPFEAEFLPAALLHDALYAAEVFPRQACDKIFLDFMFELAVSRWRRRLMYLAVRWFGGKVWRGHTLIGKSEARSYVTIS